MNGQVRFREAHHAGETAALKAVKHLTHLHQVEIDQGLHDELLKGWGIQQEAFLPCFGIDEDMRSGYQAILPYSQSACEPRSLF